VCIIFVNTVFNILHKRIMDGIGLIKEEDESYLGGCTYLMLSSTRNVYIYNTVHVLALNTLR
jgi:hypothetical protein